MFGNIYLACKILIIESHQPIVIFKIFNRLHAILPKGFRAGSLKATEHVNDSTLKLWPRKRQNIKLNN